MKFWNKEPENELSQQLLIRVQKLEKDVQELKAMKKTRRKTT